MTQDDLKYDDLIGRSFNWGTRDCFSMVRDFYRENFDMQITNYARPSDWSSDEVDLMRVCSEREGFELIPDWKVKDLRPGDVLCMAIGEANPNHFAIFVGGDQLIHHLYGRTSSKETFRGFHRNATCFLLRHPSVPDLRPVYPDVDIRTLIDARNAPPTG